LFQLASTLKQLGDSSIIHGNISSESVFVTQAGEWRIGIMDYISTMTEPDHIITTYGTVLGSYAVNIPPEVKKDGWTTLKRS
jgi:SCY1-like protein 1